jgi:predicted permease
VRHLRALLIRAVAVFRSEPREFNDELESHLALHADANMQRGMTAEDARRDAVLALGGLDQTRERYRDRRGLPALEHLIRDARFGARTLRRHPGFTIVAVLTLALGIGANTAIFSIVNAVLLRPLPFPQADRLVLVWATDTRRSEDVASYPDFEDWRAGSGSFDHMAAFTNRGATLTGGAGDAELVAAMQVTPGFFETVGVLPSLGRTFEPAESDAGSAHVAILTAHAWTRRFGGRADVLGQMIRINEELHTIVGVMPADFIFSAAEPEEVYVPIARDPSRNHGFLRIVGRLKPGVGRSAAQAEMDVIARRLATQYPKTNKDVGANVEPLVAALAGSSRTSLLIFLGVVTLVLLIACTNVANLMLARYASRQKELALRTALGAGRARLVQQLLAESTLLALAGGTVGLLLASWGTRLLIALLAKTVAVPRIENTHADVWVLAFTLGLSLATGIVFGMLPALAVASRHVSSPLRDAGRTMTAGVSGRRLRSGLMIAETALALILLAGAGLLLKGLFVMRTTSPGFASDHVLTVNFRLPKSKLAHPIEWLDYYRQTLARVGAIPGVRSAALVADLPLNGGSDSLDFHIPGRPDPSPAGAFKAEFNIVSPGYFRTMMIPLRAGREFNGDDVMNAPGVIVVNAAAARRFWPGENAVGQRIELPGPDNTSRPLTVVGVTGDVRQRGLGIAPLPEIFLNYQQPAPAWSWLVLVAQTTPDPITMADAIKSAAQSVDRGVPISQIRTLDDVLSRSLAAPRVYTWLLSVFAALALALAAVGLYGVVSYAVTQRTQEIGIRMALGANRGGVIRLVLRQGLTLTLIGAAIGLGGAAGVSRLLPQLMPGVQPGDPLMFAAASAVLVASALAASVLPARRAARVDPMIALRDA